MKVYLDDIEQVAGWSVGTTTGLVTFGAAPGAGVGVTADFEFDVPVRFDTDHRPTRHYDLPRPWSHRWPNTAL